MNEEVTCLQLWKIDAYNGQTDSYVLEAQENLKQYAKQDWAVMGEEARQMIEHMTDKVKASQEFSEEDFDRLCSHLEGWFFKVDRTIMDNLALCALFDPNYISFFNKYTDGLNIYVYKMVKRYSHKLPFKQNKVDYDC